jgi:hypothetical protein
MDSPIADNLVQVAALKAVTVLVQQYVSSLVSKAVSNAFVVFLKLRHPWYLT